VLSVLPKSWFGKQSRTHQARVIHSLARAAHAACYLGIGNKPIQISLLLSEKFPDGILWILMPCVLMYLYPSVGLTCIGFACMVGHVGVDRHVGVG